MNCIKLFFTILAALIGKDIIDAAIVAIMASSDETATGKAIAIVGFMVIAGIVSAVMMTNQSIAEYKDK